MNTTQTVVLIVHTFIAIMIIVLVLLQRGKGADAGAAFGAGASGTVFGARGSANFFSRATAVLATAFFASSLILAYLSSQQADRPASLIEGAPAPAPADDTGQGNPNDAQQGAPNDAGEQQPDAGAPAEAPATNDKQAETPDNPELPAMQSEKPPESANDDDDQGDR